MRVLGVVLALIALAASVPAASPVQRRGSSTCQRARRPRLPRITSAERRAITGRHARASAAETRHWLGEVPQPLVLRVSGRAEPFRIVPGSDRTSFDEAALGIAEEALACRTDGTTHPIHPRLIALLYGAVRHFGVPYVNVVSGYRHGNPSSRHAQGRAVDFALPGVSDARLAAWLRPQGFVGVGIYPTSGFVHLDVRARSYYWRDTSAPREHNRERQILRALGPRHDRDARARGVEPVPDASAEACETDAEIEVEVETSEAEASPVTTADAGVP